MTFKIHFTYADGTDDSIVVSGDTDEEIRIIAEKEILRRGGQAALDSAWSEEIRP